MATKLSVNINKIATLRNSRGGNNPNVVQVAIDCQKFGADGITVHPRPDERHIRYSDVYDLVKVVTTEFNIEGNPMESKFVDLVLAAKPTQVTLVPDTPGQLTSNFGWDTIKEKQYLQHIIGVFKNAGIRVSIFVDPIETMVAGAAETGTDRVELYTEYFAKNFFLDKEEAVSSYVAAGRIANKLGLGLNAGHDLDLHNLAYYCKSVPNVLEVSIGHAIISDALYYGLENTIQMYQRKLK